MLLTAFHVQRFHNVLDSTPIEGEPDITCLVGKNESGNDRDSAGRVPPAADGGRSLTRRRGNIDDAQPITATFVLDAPTNRRWTRSSARGH